MNRLISAGAACAVSLAALSACSQETGTASVQPAAAVDTTDVEAAAQAYLDAYPVSELMGEMTNSMSAQMPAEQQAQIRAAMENVRTDTLEAAMRRSMVTHFSASELRALAAFYGSPEGRRVMDKMPAYMGDVMPSIQQEMARAVGETMRQ